MGKSRSGLGAGSLVMGKRVAKEPKIEWLVYSGDEQGSSTRALAEKQPPKKKTRVTPAAASLEQACSSSGSKKGKTSGATGAIESAQDGVVTGGVKSVPSALELATTTTTSLGRQEQEQEQAVSLPREGEDAAVIGSTGVAPEPSAGGDGAAPEPEQVVSLHRREGAGVNAAVIIVSAGAAPGPSASGDGAAPEQDLGDDCDEGGLENGGRGSARREVFMTWLLQTHPEDHREIQRHALQRQSQLQASLDGSVIDGTYPDVATREKAIKDQVTAEYLRLVNNCKRKHNNKKNRAQKAELRRGGEMQSGDRKRHAMTAMERQALDDTSLQREVFEHKKRMDCLKVLQTAATAAEVRCDRARKAQVSALKEWSASQSRGDESVMAEAFKEVWQEAKKRAEQCDTQREEALSLLTSAQAGFAAAAALPTAADAAGAASDRGGGQAAQLLVLEDGGRDVGGSGEGGDDEPLNGAPCQMGEGGDDDGAPSDGRRRGLPTAAGEAGGGRGGVQSTP